MLKPQSLNRINESLIFAILITAILYFGKQVLIVLVFSAFLAMLMTPLSSKLEKKGVSRALASLLSTLLIIIVIALVIIVVSAQFAAFIEDLPQIQKKIEEFITATQAWIENNLGLSSEQQVEGLKEQVKKSSAGAGNFLSGFLKGIGSLVGGLVLILVFTFLFLLQRNKYEEFILKTTRDEKKKEVTKIMGNIAHVAQQYLKGRVISMILLGIFYVIGFLVLGLKNAVLLAVIAALLSFIPYVGPLVGGLLPVFMVLVTESSMGKALGVVIILLIAQAIDNYITEPLVVGGSVNISPFFSIFILILGGSLWGVAGVILFLPMLAMVKIVLENINGLEPYAFLIGEEDKTSMERAWDKVKKFFKRK